MEKAKNISLRDYMATNIVAGILQSTILGEFNNMDISVMAYTIADEMLHVRSMSYVESVDYLIKRGIAKTVE